jgi:hypothetical protein
MEKGSAEIKIKLWNGKIKVTHGTCKSTLAEWIASKGDWDKLWSTIDKMVKKNNGRRAGWKDFSED